VRDKQQSGKKSDGFHYNAYYLFMRLHLASLSPAPCLGHVPRSCWQIFYNLGGPDSKPRQATNRIPARNGGTGAVAMTGTSNGAVTFVHVMYSWEGSAAFVGVSSPSSACTVALGALTNTCAH
jgi:hypothetical protein